MWRRAGACARVRRMENMADFASGEASLVEKLRAALPERRFRHSLGVADEAAALAERYGADVARARLAGLLHDCAKGFPVEEQVPRCDAAGIALDEETRNCPPVVHGCLGAWIAQREYGVSDPDVLRAIRLHTVGAADMTLLDKIVWLADKTEPGRAFEGVDEIRAASRRDLDEAIRMSLTRQLRRAEQGGRRIHPGAVVFLRSLEGARTPPKPRPAERGTAT